MTRYLFVGSYTQSWPGNEHRAAGIYTFRVQPDGSLTDFTPLESGKNPSFLALHPSQRYLFSVNELDEGGVSAYALDLHSVRLTFLNSQPTDGAAPCFVRTDPSGRWLMTANYTSGSLAVHPIQADGRLGPMADHIQHHGSGPHPNQNCAHAHSIAFAPDSRYIISCDLGMDEVHVYLLDDVTGKLSLHGVAHAAPGAGPRHFAFHPRLPFLYVANELNCTVTQHAWDAQTGQLKPLASWSTLPEGFNEDNSVADIHVHPSGKYVYVSNRGHNSLAMFGIDAQDGHLTPLGHTSSGGEIPRNFTLIPEGNFAYVANQNSGNLVCFQLDEQTGRLTPTGAQYAIHAPVYLQVVDL